MIIFILGGFLRKRSDGSYGSDRISYMRILAGYYLYKKLAENNKVELIVSGGKGIYKGIRGIPPVATIMRQELVELGISSKKIKVDKTDFTYPELIWLKKYIVGEKTETFIISSAYHFPRIKTMINLLPDLKKLKTMVKLVPAEKIVLKSSKKMGPEINNYINGPEMKKLLVSEKKGIKDLKSGKYKSPHSD